MGVVSNDIDGRDFKSAYLLYGEEAYLRGFYKNALKNALVNENDTLNYSYYEGAGTNVDEVSQLLQTLPFMADYRVVIVENSGWLSKASSDSDGEEKGAGKYSELIDTIKNLGSDTVVIFVEEKVDKRSKLYKAIQSKGAIEEYAPQTEEKLARWVANMAASYGKKMDLRTSMYLVSESGLDMLLLKNEVDKLVAYCLDREAITEKDVDLLCTHQITNKIFDMISAIALHRQKEALRLYYDLLALRESPFHILTLLVRQYTQMLAVKDGALKGEPASVIASKLGIQEWLAKRYADQTRNMKLSEIKRNLEACANADESIKSGNLIDSMSVELLIVSCSMPV